MNLVRALGLVCEGRNELIHLTEKYPNPATEDLEWIRHLGKDGGWIIVSGDPRITRRTAEKDAWKESNLTAFFFKDGFVNMNRYDQAVFLFKRWRDIVMQSKNANQGTGHFVYQTKVEIIYNI